MVGVVGDIRYRRLREATPTIYLPWRQLVTFGVIAIRTSLPLQSVLPVMHRTAQEIDPQLDVWTARTMDDYLGDPWRSLG